MNTFCKSVFASTLSALMLASCANEELSVATENGGSVVTMTVTASREGGDVTSRTQLTDNNTGRLDCVWTAGDCLYVTDASGIVKGVLTLTDGAGSSFATFTGDLYGVRNGATVFNYVYLGTKNNGLAFGAGQNSFTADYSSQEGTLMSLAYNDMMTATATVTVNKGNAAVDNINLQRRVSFARFQLNLPDDATIGHPCNVTLSGELLCNGASVNFADRAVTTAQGDVTVTTSAEGDFYMTYLPTASEYKLTFTATDGENTYAGEYEVKSAIGENVYFRKKLVENENASYVAIPVEMKKVGEDEPTPPAEDSDVVGPVFTVNGKTFRFTRANLKWDVDNKEWSLMERQYSFICKGGWEISNGTWPKTKETAIDIYGWAVTGLYDIESGETAQSPAFWRQTASQTYSQAHAYYPTNNTTYNGGYDGSYLEHGVQFTNFDWGKAYYMQKNPEGDYDNDYRYFTLSSKDWTALRAGYFMAGATITDLPNPGNSNKNGLYGCLIFGVSDKASAKVLLEQAKVTYVSNSLTDNLNFSGTNYQYFNYDWIKMTAAQFDELEKLGVVFLPEAGHKATDSMTKTDGYYWTATAGQSTTAVMFRFDGNSSPKQFKLDAQVGRSLGGAVRLVKEVSVAGN